MKRANGKAVCRLVLSESLPTAHKLIMIAILTYSDGGADIDENFIAEKSGIGLNETSLILFDLHELGYLSRLTVQKRNRTYSHYSLSAKILNISE